MNMSHDVRQIEASDDASPGPASSRAHIQRMITDAVRSDASIGVVHIDLDRFHRVNSRHGQRAGDLVLAEVGHRIADELAPGSWVASVDGDGFIVLVPGAEADAILSVATTLLGRIMQPIELEAPDGRGGLPASDVRTASSSLGVRASAGIAWRSPGDEPGDLLERAFLACRRAKATAPGTVVGYELAAGAEAERRQRIEDELRHAIEDDQLALFVQPEVSCVTGEIVGVEALVRWNHPLDGLLLPGAFLPDAEAAGLMVDIGDWVVDHAVELAARWRRARDGRPLRVWINLAAQQLEQGERLIARMQRALDDDQITADCVGFEVTESSLLQDIPGAVGVLTSLRALRFEVTLDDFGTGYSSLTYLRQLPVTGVKIDRQFVEGMQDGSLADEAIVEAVIELSHALGLSVVAEGVETVEQAERLASLGTDYFQGYLFGHPVEPDEFERNLAAPTEALGLFDGDRFGGGPIFHAVSARSRLFLTVLDSAHDSIVLTAVGWRHQSDHPIVYANPAFLVESGYSLDEVIGRSVEALFADPEDAELSAWFAHLDTDGRSSTIEMANRRADGSVFLCETTVSPISDERGFLTHWLHVRRDLTARRAAEGDRARFQRLIEQTNLFVCIVEAGGRWTYMNEPTRRAFGVPLDLPLEQINMSERWSAVLDGSLVDDMQSSMMESGNWSGEITVTHAETGELVDISADVQMFDDPLLPGNSVIAGVGRDVSTEKRRQRSDRRRADLDRFTTDLAGRALREDAGDFLADVDSLLNGVLELLDADLVYLDAIDVEAGVLRPLGGARRSPLPAGTPEPSEVPLAVIPHWIRHLSEQDLVSTTTAVEAAEAPWRVELASVFPAHLFGVNTYASLRVGGVLVGVLGMSSLRSSAFSHAERWAEEELATIRSIADTLAHQLVRQRAADDLRTSQQRSAALLAAVTDVLVVVDSQGWITFANPAVLRRLGRTVESMIGRHFLEIVHPDDQDVAIERFTDVIQASEHVPITELRVVHADGTAAWYDIDASGVFDPAIGGYMFSLRDVSVQREVMARAERDAEWEAVVLGLSRWAIEVRGDELLDGLSEHLERLGQVLGVDSAFAALIDDEQVHNVVGWSAVGSPADYEMLPAPTVPALIAEYRRLVPLVVDDIDHHDEPWAHEWRAFPASDRSGLNVPLAWEGRCLGNLGIAMKSVPRHWTGEEIALVQRFASTVSALVAHRATELSLKLSQDRLNALLNGSHDLVVVVDAQGVVSYANIAVIRSLGYEVAEVVGMHMSGLIHPDDLSLALEWLASLSQDQPTSMTVLRLVDAQGVVGSWEITSGAFRDPQSGARVLTCRDVTARIKQATEANTWVELLRHAFEIAQMALDLGSREFIAELPSICEDIGHVLGVERIYIDRIDELSATVENLAIWTSPSGLGDMRIGLAPGERAPFDALEPWLRRLQCGEPVVSPDSASSAEPWLLAQWSVMGPRGADVAVGLSAAGELFGVLGASTSEPRAWTDDEVTFVRIVAETIAHVLERARLDDALRTSESRFRLLSENAADVVLLVDAKGTITYASPSSFGLLGLHPAMLVGTKAVDRTHPDDAEEAARQLGRLVATGFNVTELRLRRADGSEVWVANSTSTVFDPETGGAVEYRVSLRDVTDRKRLEEQLEWQTLHDPLTGLGNRLLLRRNLDLAVARRGRPNDVTVLNIDLDGFKDVNDSYGHAVGDEVLRVMARRFEEQTRPTDTLARTGGDEFVLLCPETPAEGAVALASRIIEAARAPMSIGERSISLGVSIGVAHRSAGELDTDPDTLLIRADHAMYEAKRSGRGTVRLARTGDSATPVW